MTGRIRLHGARLLSILFAVLATAGCRPTPPPPTAQPTVTYRPFRAEGKWIIAINEDIDPDNTDAVFWAMSYRC